MRVVLLHSHPVEESYSAAIRDRAVESLRGAGHDVTLRRLGTGDDPGPTSADLAGVEALVLVHPVWWGSQPAPLLAWIQRVLGPAIDSPSRRHDQSPLRSVRELVAITTHGSSHFINTLQGEPGRKLLQRSVLPLCAPDAELRWLALYKLDRLERHDLDGFVDRVGDELAGLTTARASA